MFTSETIINNCQRCIKSESQCEMCEWNCQINSFSILWLHVHLADDQMVLFIRS